MKIIKALILVLLMAAIGICGYLAYQNYTEKEDVTCVDESEQQVIQINDSTYHINLSDCSCMTMEKNGDTLFIDAVGVNFIHANHTNDSIEATIRVGTLRTYVVNYGDFFDTAQIKDIRVNFPDN